MQVLDRSVLSKDLCRAPAEPTDLSSTFATVRAKGFCDIQLVVERDHWVEPTAVAQRQREQVWGFTSSDFCPNRPSLFR